MNVCEKCGAVIPARELRFANVWLDLETHEVTRDGLPVELGPMEFRLLSFLMKRPRRLVSRRQLFVELWGVDFSETSNVLTVLLSTLRKKLGSPSLIHTIRGEGVVLRELTR